MKTQPFASRDLVRLSTAVWTQHVQVMSQQQQEFIKETD
jgi:hypothetical protein